MKHNEYIFARKFFASKQRTGRILLQNIRSRNRWPGEGGFSSDIYLCDTHLNDNCTTDKHISGFNHFSATAQVAAMRLSAYFCVHFSRAVFFCLFAVVVD